VRPSRIALARADASLCSSPHASTLRDIDVTRDSRKLEAARWRLEIRWIEAGRSRSPRGDSALPGFGGRQMLFLGDSRILDRNLERYSAGDSIIAHSTVRSGRRCIGVLRFQAGSILDYPRIVRASLCARRRKRTASVERLFPSRKQRIALLAQ